MYFCVSSQVLQVPITDMKESDKQENFFIVLGRPKWLKQGIPGECVSINVRVIRFHDYSYQEHRTRGRDESAECVGCHE